MTPNVMTIGFNLVVRHAPPLIGCVIDPWDHSHQALRASRKRTLLWQQFQVKL